MDANNLIGNELRFKSKNYPDRFFRHRNFEIWLDLEEKSQLYLLDSSFKVVPGLSGASKGISLESKNYPGYFIRHSGFVCYIHKNDGSDLFKKDATWIPRAGLADNKYVSFESDNYRNYFMRHSGFRVRIDLKDGSDLFNLDASWLRLGDDQAKEQVNNLTTGLVAHYPFDGNANDVSGNAHNGKIQGAAALVDDRFGKPNKAYQFNGTKDMMLIDKPISLGQEWTIAAWFNTRFPVMSWNTLTRGKAGDHQVIISKAGKLGTFDNVKGTGFKDSGYNIKALSGWHHIAATAKNNKTNFYIDGKLVGSVNFQSKSDIYAIGNYQGGGQAFGTIDDFRIYNSSLSAEKIQELYNQGSDFKVLVAHYPFDGNANDVSGNAHNGKIQGAAALVDDRFGKPNKAYQFNGAKDVLLINKPILLEEEWTIAAWFNTRFPDMVWNTLTRGQVGDHQVIISKDGKLGTFDNVGKTGFKDSGYNVKTLSGWHHIAATAKNNKTNFYIDGKLVGSVNFQSKSDIYAIGNYQGGGQAFGTIDDFRIYNFALSGEKIQELYNQGSDFKVLVAHYPFDGNANDVSGNAHNGKIQGAAALVDDRFGKPNRAYQFNGSKDVMLIDKPISLGQEWTIAAWFNTRFPDMVWNTLTRGQAGDHQVIISKDGKLGTFDNVKGTGFKDSGYNIKALSGWHHIAATAKNNKTNFYIDGKLVGSVNFQSKTDIYAIGNYQGGGQAFGTIDDFRIYNFALSESEIKSLHKPDTTCKDSPIEDGQTESFESIGITKEYLDIINAMTGGTKTARIQMLRGKADCFASNNPVLKNGEWGYEIDTYKLKIGDGKTHWNELNYKVDQVFTQILKERIEKSQLIEEKGQPDGYAPLDKKNKVPRKYLPDTFAINVVNTIIERNNLTEKYKNMLVFVIDASADKTVEKGSAIYIWANSTWIKVSEFESMDIDFSVYFNKERDTLDVIKEGDKYIHFTNEYKKKIEQNEKNITSNAGNIRDIQLFIKYLLKRFQNKDCVISGGKCSEIDWTK